VQNGEAKGYLGAIVFNRTGQDGCETLVSMQVAGGIPAVFVSRTDGFRILGGLPAGYGCDASVAGTAAPPVGTDGQTVDQGGIRRMGPCPSLQREHPGKGGRIPTKISHTSRTTRAGFACSATVQPGFRRSAATSTRTETTSGVCSSPEPCQGSQRVFAVYARGESCNGPGFGLLVIDVPPGDP